MSLDADAKRFGLDANDVSRLRVAAVQAKKGAYCPYSKFSVGAALLTAEGHILTGANVENAAYPVTICAERVAMGKAVADGCKSFKAIAVAIDNAAPGSPCGMCRQFINEFCEPSMPIYMFGKQPEEEEGGSSGEAVSSRYMVRTLGELLPDSFGPESLPINVR